MVIRGGANLALEHSLVIYRWVHSDAIGPVIVGWSQAALWRRLEGATVRVRLDISSLVINNSLDECLQLAILSK